MALVYKKDTDANDSNKTWTVPTGKTWKMLWMQVDLTATATVGNRQLELQLLDTADAVAGQYLLGDVVTASEHVDVIFGSGGLPYTGTVVDDGVHYVPLPENLIALSGWDVKVFDSAAVDAAADDMLVYFMVTEHSA